MHCENSAGPVHSGLGSLKGLCKSPANMSLDQGLKLLVPPPRTCETNDYTAMTISISSPKRCVHANLAVCVDCFGTIGPIRSEGG